MKQFKWQIILMMFLIVVVLVLSAFLAGCREAEKVSYNLSLEADNFNVTRRLVATNIRTDSILFEMMGNFSIEVDYDNDLNIIGENPDGTFYKHFVRLTPEVVYVVQDMGTTTVDKYQFTINFNPQMIRQIEPDIVD